MSRARKVLWALATVGAVFLIAGASAAIFWCN